MKRNSLPNNLSTGSVRQVTMHLLRANTIYTLTLYLGARADLEFSGYFASLMAGTVTLASDSTLNPSPGTFLLDTFIYTSGPSPGQPFP